MNRLKSVVLLATLTALLLWAGQALGGRGGLLIALAVAGLMNVGAYWWSDRLILRMYGAREVTATEAPDLWSIVRNLAARADLPMPRVYIIPEEAPNAFATGRNPQHAAVAVTAGLLHLLDREELEGVLAHELAHVRHRDTLVMTVTASLAGALSMLANMAMWSTLFGGSDAEDEDGSHPLVGLLGIMVAPFAATLIQLAISGSREFLADELGAGLTRNPLARPGQLVQHPSLDWGSHRTLASDDHSSGAGPPAASGGLVQLCTRRNPFAYGVSCGRAAKPARPNRLWHGAPSYDRACQSIHNVQHLPRRSTSEMGARYVRMVLWISRAAKVRYPDSRRISMRPLP
jgi:heat shock protein HtpX